jgi:hypothetical protein
MRRSSKPYLTAIPALLAVGLLAACGQSVSTSSFHGEEREVAQAIANFQSDVTSSDQGKVCSNDLAAPVLARLAHARGGCRQVIKEQLGEVESYDLKVDSVHVSVPGHAASASVRSLFAGRTRASTLSLVKEGTRWKLAALA